MAMKKDINTANQRDLEEIPQMSAARAETILHYREQHGDFKSVEDLTAVPGIGQIMAQQMAEFFSFGDAEVEEDEDEGQEDEGQEDDGGSEGKGKSEDKGGGKSSQGSGAKKRSSSRSSR